VTGVPVGRTATPPGPPFDVFTPIRRPEQDEAAGQAAGPAPGQGGDPYLGASPYQGADAYQGDSPYRDAGPYPGGGSAQDGAAYQDGGQYGGLGSGQATAGPADPGAGGPGTSDLGGAAAESAADDGFNGLPRRVRQASLAPQLRVSTASGPQGPSAVPPATAASLTDMRNTLSAMQRGWQQGRSQTQQDAEDGTDGN
jgi:hypothetical protein